MSASMAAVVPQCGKCGSKIRSDGRLADASFAGCYGENTGFDARLVERILFAFGLEACHKLGELVLTHGPDFDARQQCRFRI